MVVSKQYKTTIEPVEKAVNPRAWAGEAKHTPRETQRDSSHCFVIEAKTLLLLPGEMKAIFACFAAFLAVSNAIYLPGVAPREFLDGEPVCAKAHVLFGCPSAPCFPFEAVAHLVVSCVL